MKNALKFLGVITLAVIFGLSFIACGDDPEPEPAKKSNDAGLGAITVKGIPAVMAADKTGTANLYGNEAADVDVVSVVATAKHAKAKVTGITVKDAAYTIGAKDVSFADGDKIVVNIEAEDGTKAAYTVTASVVTNYTLAAINVDGPGTKFTFYKGDDEAKDAFVTALEEDKFIEFKPLTVDSFDLTDFDEITTISYTDKGAFLLVIATNADDDLVGFGLSSALTGTGADMSVVISIDSVVLSVTTESGVTQAIFGGGKWSDANGKLFVSPVPNIVKGNILLHEPAAEAHTTPTPEFIIAFETPIDFTGKQLEISGSGNPWWGRVYFVFENADVSWGVVGVEDQAGQDTWPPTPGLDRDPAWVGKYSSKEFSEFKAPDEEDWYGDVSDLTSGINKLVAIKIGGFYEIASIDIKTAE